MPKQGSLHRNLHHGNQYFGYFVPDMYRGWTKQHKMVSPSLQPPPDECEPTK